MLDRHAPSGRAPRHRVPLPSRAGGVALAGAVALLGLVGCGDTTQREETRNGATAQEIAAFVRASQPPPPYWLGTAFEGHPVKQAARVAEGVLVGYGPATCAGVSSCTWALTTTTSADRSPADDRRGGICVHRAGGVVVLACSGTGLAEAFPGRQKLTVKGLDVPAAQLVAAITRAVPGATTVEPTAAFSCSELRRWPAEAAARLPRGAPCP